MGAGPVGENTPLPFRRQSQGLQVKRGLGERLGGMPDGVKKTPAHGAVNHAMVEGEAEVQLIADDDLAVDHHRRLDHGAHAENGHLRLVDDRRADDAAEGAEVGNGEGAALDVRARQLALG